MDLAQMRKTISEGLFSFSQNLEKFIVLGFPPQILSELADVIT